MGKGRRDRIRVRILKGITWAAGIVFMTSVFCLDTESWIPFIVAMISASWLGLMALANR